MAPYKKPKTLYQLSLGTFSDVIAKKCEELDNPTEYQQDIEGITRPLHDWLHEIVIPVSLRNDISEAVLAKFDVNSRPCNKHILYRVVVNDKLTRLAVRQLPLTNLGQLVRAIVPQWKNLVNLDVRSNNLLQNDELVFAISNYCRKLERIRLPDGVILPSAFCALIISCTKLRSLERGGYYRHEDNLELVITNLPDLQYLSSCQMMARLMETLGNRPPLSLLSVTERQATPANIRATANLCPRLQELELQPHDMSHSSEILGILADSPLKLTKIKFCKFDLCNDSVEKFFRVKGKYIQQLKVEWCAKSDLLNVVKLIGAWCTNLQVLKVLVDYKISVTSSFKFETPTDNEPSFRHLEKLSIENNRTYSVGEYDGEDLEAIATIMATASSIQTIHIAINRLDGVELTAQVIEEMFPIASMKNLRELRFDCLQLTGSIASYFMTNTPELLRFPMPRGSQPDSIPYMLETYWKFSKQNINFEIDRQFLKHIYGN